MVASVGYKGSFAWDASKPFIFHSEEWTRVLSRKEKKNQKKKSMVEDEIEEFEIPNKDLFREKMG